MSYEKLDRIIPLDYYLGNNLLQRVSFISDLGDMFDGRLKFDKHIEIILAESSKMFGFLRRNTKEFVNTKTIISLFESLVLPNIIYSSSVWSPSLLRQWSSLETIQHKLLRYLSNKIGQPMSYFDHNYEPLRLHFKLPTINRLFHYHDYILAYKLFHGLFLLPNITSIFIIRPINYTLRRLRIFQEYTNSTREDQSIALNRLRRLWKLVDRDAKQLRLGSYKKYIKKMVFPQ